MLKLTVRRKSLTEKVLFEIQSKEQVLLLPSTEFQSEPLGHKMLFAIILS